MINTHSPASNQGRTNATSTHKTQALPRLRHKPSEEIPPYSPAESIVEVKESMIPGAGTGAFANQDVPRGSILEDQLGESLFLSEEDYLKALEGDKSFDGITKEQMKLNGSICLFGTAYYDEEQTNVDFINHGHADTDANIAIIGNLYVTLKDIKQGDELLTDYRCLFTHGENEQLGKDMVKGLKHAQLFKFQAELCKKAGLSKEETMKIFERAFSNIKNASEIQPKESLLAMAQWNIRACYT